MHLFYSFLILIGLVVSGCNGDKKPQKIKVEVGEKVKQEVSQNIEEKIKEEEQVKESSIKNLPHFAPSLENVALNTFDPSFESESRNYSLIGGASFDIDERRSGTRSIKLQNTDDAINIYNIPVKEGSWYMFSGYIKVKSLPSDVVRFYIGYTDNGRHVHSVAFPLISTAKAGVWEEFNIPLYVQKDKDITDVKLIIRNVGEPDFKAGAISDVWIDDLSLHKVKDSAHLFGFTKPSIKKSFNGKKVKIDNLGNFEVKTDQKYESFFPLIVYPAGAYESWKKYKQKGFNTIMCHNPVDGKGAVNAGMYWVWDLYSYGVNDLSGDGFDRFVAEYEKLKRENPEVLDKLLYFYWDNEKYLVFDSFKIYSDKIKTMDVDANGDRNRPIYMHLDFTAGNKNYHNDMFELIDIQGTYANPLLYQENDRVSYSYDFKRNYNAEFANFSMFENISNTKIPKTIFVINSPQDINLENTIFAALARGGKGFAYWKDRGSQPAIETRPWWNDFSNISSKILKLKPLLKLAHWTNWELLYTLKDDEDGMVVGKRDYGNKRCMIVSSRSNKSESVTFTTKDKEIKKVYDFFDNKVVSTGVGHSFTLLFAPLQSGVYCWDK